MIPSVVGDGSCSIGPPRQHVNMKDDHILDLACRIKYPLAVPLCLIIEPSQLGPEDDHVHLSHIRAVPLSVLYILPHELPLRI